MIGWGNKKGCSSVNYCLQIIRSLWYIGSTASVDSIRAWKGMQEMRFEGECEKEQDYDSSLARDPFQVEVGINDKIVEVVSLIKYSCTYLFQ